jgi:hypothetical protein
MSYHFQPAQRGNTPYIIGLAGPTKSGKTFSALRLATGLAGGGKIAFINTEPFGHQYADLFRYEACELGAPYRPASYTEAIEAAALIKPAVLIIDSMTHMHDGPGGMNEWHDELMHEMAKGNPARVEKMNAPAWVTVKGAENHFVYTLQGLRCHVILCLRAKEKIKITKDGKWIDLGWRPIVSDRIAFETLFTLMFLPYSGGVPELTISELRTPFDTMIPKDQQINEALGERLAEWAKGGATPQRAAVSDRTPPLPAAMPSGPPARGETGGISSSGEPADWEIMVSDFVARFDESTTRDEAETWRARWVARKETVPEVGRQIVQAAVERAKARLRA